MRHLFSKLTGLEKIFLAATLAIVAIAFFTMTLPWLRCPLCQGLKHPNAPCLWSPSTGAMVPLTPYVYAPEDSQWEYGNPPLLQQSFPSRRTAVIRLPARTDSTPYFCPSHRDFAFIDRELMVSVVEDNGFTVTTAVNTEKDNHIYELDGTVILTPGFNRELDCWELTLRWS